MRGEDHCLWKYYITPEDVYHFYHHHTPEDVIISIIQNYMFVMSRHEVECSLTLLYVYDMCNTSWVHFYTV